MSSFESSDIVVQGTATVVVRLIYLAEYMMGLTSIVRISAACKAIHLGSTLGLQGSMFALMHSGIAWTSPREVRRPTTPLAEAGMRQEPPVSSHVAIGVSLAAKAAPDPPLLPTAVKLLLQACIQYTYGMQKQFRLILIAPKHIQCHATALYSNCTV